MSDPGGRSGVATDGNDPMTQHYLQMTDDAVDQQQQAQQPNHRGSSDLQSSSSSPTGMVDAALQLLQSTTSGERYEGDDELDEDTTLGTQTGPDDTEGEPEPEEIDVVNSDTAVTESGGEAEVLGVSVDGEDAAVDFVHVRLEHLPSEDDLQVRSDPTPRPQYVLSTDVSNKNDENGKFTYYRKFASQGSPSLQKTAGNGNDNDANQHQHLENISPSMEESRSPSTVNPRSERTLLTSIGDSLRAIRGEHPSPSQHENNSGLQRQKFLEGDLVQGKNTASFLKPSGRHQSKESSRFNTDDEQELQNNFDFVNMSVSHPSHASVDNGKKKQGIEMMQTQNTKRAVYKPPSVNESQIQTPVGENKDKEVHFRDLVAKHEGLMGVSGDDRYKYGSEDIDIDYTNSQAVSHTCTSEGDEETGYSLGTTPQEAKENRQERWLRRREQKFRMTLMQTMQHNTRANFCTIFLLGVAMATLVLLIAAKLTSSTKEDMYYDEDEDTHFVVTNGERLLTIEILAFGLITVLLLGSLCYLGVTTYDNKNALVRAVKHEDACLANASARRKHPTYKAPYVQDGSPNRKHYATHQDYTAGVKGQQRNTTGTIVYQDYRNQSLSMVSSGTGTDRSHDDYDEEMTSMGEDPDQMYRELEERAVCSCSPISLHASTEEMEMQTFDDED